MSEILIRGEVPSDVAAIRHITQAAFAGMEFSRQTESAIIDGLRDAGVLTLSLVAVSGSGVLGHVAFSPVRVDGKEIGWFGLRPTSVRPDRQRQGIGSTLIWDGLKRLRQFDAQGCTVLGNPVYYRRFGFESDPALYLEGPPPDHFMKLVLAGRPPAGRAEYHSAFYA
jgi:putative acetyltransferase